MLLEKIKDTYRKLKERKSPNVIIEGVFPDNWRKSYFKASKLEIPSNVLVLDDGTYRYHLQIEESDEMSKEIQNAEFKTKINDLRSCKAIASTKIFGSNILERPRALFSKDGRIFVEETVMDEYLEYLPYILKVVKNLF